MKWNETLQTAAEAASHLMGEEDAIICLSVDDANEDINALVTGKTLSLLALLALVLSKDKIFKELVMAALKYAEEAEQATEETEETTEK